MRIRNYQKFVKNGFKKDIEQIDSSHSSIDYWNYVKLSASSNSFLSNSLSLKTFIEKFRRKLKIAVWPLNFLKKKFILS